MAPTVKKQYVSRNGEWVEVATNSAASSSHDSSDQATVEALKYTISDLGTHLNTLAGQVARMQMQLDDIRDRLDTT